VRQAYDYSTHFAKIKVRQAVLDLRSVLDKHGDLVEFEISCLVNLFPRCADEAKVLDLS
jgi:DNA-directed RNA polymerase II subunit RPB4